MQDLKKTAAALVASFPGDEYWIDKPAAVTAIAAALQAERERVVALIRGADAACSIDIGGGRVARVAAIDADALIEKVSRP